MTSWMTWLFQFGFHA